MLIIYADFDSPDRLMIDKHNILIGKLNGHVVSQPLIAQYIYQIPCS